MKHALAAVSIAALSTAAFSVSALAQDEEAAVPSASVWEFFEDDGGRSGALVTAEGGAQLVLKCDKPGRREVHAIILAPSNRLAVPNPRGVSRPIRFQFDGKAPRTENWGFYEHHALAQGRTGDRALARFVTALNGSSNVRMILDTGIGPSVDLTFDTTGSSEMVERVYDVCKDSVPR